MVFSAKVLSRLAVLVGDKAGEALYSSTFDYLSDFELLNRLHWSQKQQRSAF